MTQITLRKAKSLQRDVLTGLTDAERAILADAAKGRAAEATEREDQASMLRGKSEKCADLVRNCERCILEVDAMLRQLGQGLRRLQHTRYAQFADLKVCQHRLNLRAEAPDEEACDMAQRALEEQGRCISDARFELFGLEGECRKALQMIGELRNDISKESASQRLAGEKCRANAAVLMSVSADTPEEVDVPPPNRELLPRANYLAVQAEDLLSRCSKSIQSTDKNCFRARRRAELFLENRLLETEKSAKALREQASEVDYTIAIAERSLAKSIKRCLGKENLAKAAKLEDTRSALDHLRETRQAMKLQIQNKLKMQVIDGSCRKVTSQSASRPATAGKSRQPSDVVEQSRSLPRLDQPDATEAPRAPSDVDHAPRRQRPQSAVPNRRGHL